MLARIISLFLLSLLVLGQVTYADDSKNLDELIAADREERIEKINQLSFELNQSLARLESFNHELQRARDQDLHNRGSKLIIRNATAALAAVGFISTVLFEFRGINPSKVILGTGYSVSALSAIISYLENRTIRFTREEITKLSTSVTELQKLVEIEKRNLATEIRLLCVSDGGTIETCNR